MPELPELQALAERLDEFAQGAVITSLAALQFSALKTVAPPASGPVGRPVSAVTRRGKFVVFELGGSRLLLHLGQGGRVELEAPPRRTRPKGAIVRIELDSRRAILVREYGTQRKAGWWVLGDHDDGPLARLGPEPASEEFESLLLDSDDRRRVHTLLRDQRTVAGIGRGYADDTLHRAKLSPYSSLAALDATARRRLIDAARTVLGEALIRERQRTGGLPTKMSGRFAVHGRAGEPCPRCATRMERISFEDYEIVYCPECQTGGKVLADRRFSRLIR